VSDRRTTDATLIEAVRILARDIHSEDGCANACLLEAAQRLEELVEERRWVPVGERLPQDNVAVLCCGDGVGAEMVWRENGQWHLSWVGTPISDSTYTHWQPLPPGPEGYG
jgi:Protein of unknown function (DUF551)